MGTWNPVIDGILHRPVNTNILPRIGESVRLPMGNPDMRTEKTYRVVDVRHYIAFENNSAFEDVFLTEIADHGK